MKFSDDGRSVGEERDTADWSHWVSGGRWTREGESEMKERCAVFFPNGRPFLH